MMIGRRWLVGALALVMGATACGDRPDDAASPSPDEGLRIASFDFAESALLAELYAQVVEATGTPVVRLGEVGPREVVRPAMELDLVDLTPEYLGTSLRHAGATIVDPDTRNAHRDLVVRLEPLGLTALAAAPAQNANVVVIDDELATANAVRRISDLRPLAVQLRFGGPPECPDRPLCLVGLDEVYGLQFAEFVAQESQGLIAEALRRDEIDVALMFSTDPALADRDLVVLDDDRRLQPAENVVPVIRVDALDRWGVAVASALDALSAHLSTDELRTLNRRVDDGEAIDAVARRWLERHDLRPPD